MDAPRRSCWRNGFEIATLGKLALDGFAKVELTTRWRAAGA
jgi:hypothetical protein